MNILFAGTPKTSSKILEYLQNDEDNNIVGVLTQPDKPGKRGNKLVESSVSVLARKSGLNVINSMEELLDGAGTVISMLPEGEHVKSLYLGEIGILKNNSTKMFRNYFNKAKIYAFDYDAKLLSKAKSHKLKNTFYSTMNVKYSKDIMYKRK